MESKKELKNSPKPAPKPESRFEKMKKMLKSSRDSALDAINNTVDYFLNNIQEFYNSNTNSFPKNEANLNPKFKSERVELNEEFVAQELIAKAKQEGDTKEVILNNKHPGNNNMVGSSLIVDMDVKKIDATIRELDQKLNAQPVKPPLEKPVNENKVEKKPEPQATIRRDNKEEMKSAPKVTPQYLKPTSKLKPDAPKPTPENTAKAKAKKKDELPKPAPKPVNIDATIVAMRNKFLRNQEDSPSVLEEQKYETVLKPQEPVFVIRNKNAVTGNIAAIRNNLQPNYIPDVVEDSFGVEQRKTKARLK
jgi:hypothetical protein